MDKKITFLDALAQNVDRLRDLYGIQVGQTSQAAAPTIPIPPDSPPVKAPPIKPKNAYLGEFPVDLENSPFAGYTAADWALYYVQQYGGIDGDHHKTWVLDQVARILNGTPVTVVQARWESGTTDYRVDTGKPSEKYLKWVADTKAGEDGPDTYDYDEGIPP